MSAAGTTTIAAAPARAFVGRVARRARENFPVALRLFPRESRDSLRAVYAFCRLADDLADEVGDPDASLRLLDGFERQLDACYAGRPSHPVFVALAGAIARHALPDRDFRDLLEAFRSDPRRVEVETFEELLDYSRGSANPVGRLVLRVLGAYDEGRVAFSDRICTGLQLANFWQDVVPDLERGRIYLPREDRERFGVTIEALRARRADDAFRSLLRFEVERTRAVLRGGLGLAERLPRRLAWRIEPFARAGLLVLERIESVGFDVLRRRPTIGRAAKARLLASAWLRSRIRRRPIEAAAFR